MPHRPILLIEDNPDDVELTLRALRKSNIANEVLVARDGAEAIDMLHGSDDTEAIPLPSVVLLDIKLPKIDGIEVLQRIRAHDRTRLIPVVILTSSNEQRDLVAGYSHGCNSYVRKPVSFDQFLEASRQLGLYWLILNEPPPVTTA